MPFISNWQLPKPKYVACHDIVLWRAHYAQARAALAEDEGEVYEDEAETAVITYNMAVVNFHVCIHRHVGFVPDTARQERRYSEAQVQLESVFKFIEAVGKGDTALFRFS